MSGKELKIIAVAFVAFVLFATGVMVYILVDDRKEPQVVQEPPPAAVQGLPLAVEQPTQVKPPSRKYIVFTEICNSQKMTQAEIDTGIELADQNGDAWDSATDQERLACCVFLGASLFENETTEAISAASGLLFSYMTTMRKEEKISTTGELAAIFVSLSKQDLIEKARQIVDDNQRK